MHVQTKYNVFPIKEFTCSTGDEKLAAVCVLSTVCLQSRSTINNMTNVPQNTEKKTALKHVPQLNSYMTEKWTELLLLRC